MAKQKIIGGVVHEVPDDLGAALGSSKAILQIWNSLTPLARNEWICWNITVKQVETRKNHIERTIKELQQGKRRPCCWIGCIHRADKPLSPSVRGILGKRSSQS